MRDKGSREQVLSPVDTSSGLSLAELRTPVAPGDRSCCCPSRPVVRVVLPPTPQRDHPVDLLLCAHHYRRSSETLVRNGAHVFDAAGTLMFTSDPAARDRVAR